MIDDVRPVALWCVEREGAVEAKLVVEASLEGHLLVRYAEVPLAHQARCVTVFLEDLGECDFGGGNALLVRLPFGGKRGLRLHDELPGVDNPSARDVFDPVGRVVLHDLGFESVAVLNPSGHDPRARRGAGGRGDVAFFEDHALGANLIDVGRRDVVRAVCRHFVLTQVVR